MDINLSRLTRREFFVSVSLIFFGIAARHAFASVHTDAYQSGPCISGYSAIIVSESLHSHEKQLV